MALCRVVAVSGLLVHRHGTYYIFSSPKEADGMTISLGPDKTALIGELCLLRPIIHNTKSFMLIAVIL